MKTMKSWIGRAGIVHFAAVLFVSGNGCAIEDDADDTAELSEEQAIQDPVPGVPLVPPTPHRIGALGTGSVYGTCAADFPSHVVQVYCELQILALADGRWHTVATSAVQQGGRWASASAGQEPCVNSHYYRTVAWGRFLAISNGLWTFWTSRTGQAIYVPTGFCE